MNNKGSVRGNSLFRRIKVSLNKIGASYIYKLVSKILSFLGTIFLIFLVVIGSLMFYFNTKAKSYSNKGVNYVPPFGLYTIISGSMDPSIKVYDVVVSVSERDLSKVKVGDIITFISTWDVNYGKTITHRVVSVSKNVKGEYQFTTKGDNNEAPDGAVVNQANFVGKVVMRLPQLGRLQFFLATKMGWFLVVFIPALGVIIYDVLKIFKLSILKREINNVSNVGDLNIPANSTINTEPIYEVQTSEEVQAIGANGIVNTLEATNAPDAISTIPANQTLEASNVETINTLDVMQAAPIEQANAIGNASLETVNNAPPIDNSSPQSIETFEIDAELPMPASNVSNEANIEISAPAPEVIVPEPTTIESQTPINSSNIVQTNTNINTNQITRSPLARRSSQTTNTEPINEKKQEEAISIPSKVMDLEDMVNIKLPVMKANAAAGIPEEGPLATRQ